MLLMIGCMSFLIMLINDLNQIYLHWNIGKYAFGIGCALLAGVTGLLIYRAVSEHNTITWIQWIFMMICLLFFMLLIYTLFFALPFEGTYVEQEKLKVYDQGVYALCRHPGILWFFGFYIFLAAALASIELGLAAILFSTMNLLYAWIQDKLIFPRTLSGYEAYQQKVPFLIPDKASFMESLHK